MTHSLSPMLCAVSLKRFVKQQNQGIDPAQDSHLVEASVELISGNISLSEGLRIVRELTQYVVVHLDALIVVMQHFEMRANSFNAENIRDFASIMANISAYYPELLKPFLPTLTAIVPPNLLSDYLFMRELDEPDVFLRFTRLLKNIANEFTDVGQIIPGDIIYEFIATYLQIFVPLGDISFSQFETYFIKRWDSFVNFVYFLRTIMLSGVTWLANEGAIFGSLLVNCLAFKETSQYYLGVLYQFEDDEQFLRAFLGKITPLSTCSDELYICAKLSRTVHFQDYCNLNDYLLALIDVKTHKYRKLYDEIISNQLMMFGDDVIFELDENQMTNLPYLLESGDGLECYKLFTEE